MADLLVNRDGGYTFFDQQAWPLHPEELSYRLRYASETAIMSKSDRLRAAAYIDAYVALTRKPPSAQRLVLTRLRQAWNIFGLKREL